MEGESKFHQWSKHKDDFTSLHSPSSSVVEPLRFIAVPVLTLEKIRFRLRFRIHTIFCTVFQQQQKFVRNLAFSMSYRFMSWIPVPVPLKQKVAVPRGSGSTTVPSKGVTCRCSGHVHSPTVRRAGWHPLRGRSSECGCNIINSYFYTFLSTLWVSCESKGQVGSGIIFRIRDRIRLFRLSICQFFKILYLKAVLRIHDILGWIRIRGSGSMPLTNGSGSWSCYFFVTDLQDPSKKLIF